MHRGGSHQFFNNRSEDDKYALGIGLDVKQIKDFRVLVDYTILFDRLANTQRISLGVEF